MSAGDLVSGIECLEDNSEEVIVIECLEESSEEVIVTLSSFMTTVHTVSGE